jgi:hypothetical protein
MIPRIPNNISNSGEMESIEICNLLMPEPQAGVQVDVSELWEHRRCLLQTDHCQGKSGGSDYSRLTPH